MDEIKSKIKTMIDANNVVLFMKGTPNSPQCGFSMAVTNILKHLQICNNQWYNNFNAIN